MFGIGTPELVLFAIIAVILFGGRLPSVARSLGKSIVEFKKGLRGIEEEIDDSTNRPSARPGAGDRIESGDAPKFT